MEILFGLLMINVGFIAGATLTSFIARWIALVVDTLKQPIPHPRRMAVLVSLFHAGPWMLVVVAIFAYFTYSERWAQLVGIGIVAWGIFVTTFLRRIQARRRSGVPRKEAV